MKHISILIAILNLIGCANFLDDYSSEENMHRAWVRDRKLCIGKYIDSCSYFHKVNYTQELKNRGFDSRLLKNGNRENDFSYYFKCLYSYEYDPKTEIIVDFRFEDLEFEQTKKNYGCRLTGA